MGILDYLKNPNVMNQLMMAGEAFKAADQSRPANLAPFMERSEQLQGQERINKMRQKLVEGGLLQRMLQQRGYSPESLGVLTSALEAAPGAVLPQVLNMAFPQNTSDPYARYKVVPGLGVVDLEKFRTGEGNGVVAAAPERSDPYSDIGKLRADLNAGRITQEEFNAKVAKITSAGGIAMRYNPETGEMEFTTNAGPGWGKAAENTLDDKTIQTAESYARLGRIQEMIDNNPDVLDIGTLPSQLKTGAYEWGEYLGMELDPESTAYLERFTEFKGEIRENLSLVLNALSGAAVSPHEEERLKGFLPTDKDSPTVLKTKIRRAQEANAAALARYHMWRKSGGVGKPWEKQTIYDVERMMKAEREKIISETRKRLEGMDPNSPEYKALRDNLLKEGERKFAEMFGV